MKWTKVGRMAALLLREEKELATEGEGNDRSRRRVRGEEGESKVSPPPERTTQRQRKSLTEEVKKCKKKKKKNTLNIES